jgi:hypothetical protein
MEIKPECGRRDLSLALQPPLDAIELKRKCLYELLDTK